MFLVKSFLNSFSGLFPGSEDSSVPKNETKDSSEPDNVIKDFSVLDNVTKDSFVIDNEIKDSSAPDGETKDLANENNEPKDEIEKTKDSSVPDNEILDLENKQNNNGDLVTSEKLKIVLILDASGSMNSIKNEMRISVNEFISGQQNIKDDGTTFTLVKFSDIVETIIDDIPIDKVKLMEPKEYSTNGITALFDAIGSTIDRFKEQPNVLMVIVTDGQENASTQYKDKKQITQMISDSKQKNNWSFVYLSSDADTFTQGDSLGCGNSSRSSNILTHKSKMSEFMTTNLKNACFDFRKHGKNINKELNASY